MRGRTLLVVLGLVLTSATWTSHGFSAEPPPADSPFGDFSWMHGANYTPSYAATDVQTWLQYDHQTVDRELGYAERIGLNCVRVFLQSLVWEHDRELFLKNFEDFVSTADAHGLKVMPIIFDSCFGVSPSLESSLMWVANPGPDRMSERDYDELDVYVKDLVSRYAGDERIALWDVMNEPAVTVLSQTEEGKAQVWAFVSHYCKLVKKLDPTHAVTVGVSSADNSNVVDVVDVLSCHSYAPSEKELREKFSMTKKQAADAGKPWIVSECCAPGWGSPYEMVLPVLREFAVGHTVWEVVIGRNQFAPISGLFYPDGTVRRLTSIEVVINAKPDGYAEKPDSQGVPIARQRAGRLAEYARFAARNAVTEETWRERNTLAYAAALINAYGDKKAECPKRLEVARAAYTNGDKQEAFETVEQLLKIAADILTERDKPAPADHVMVDVKRKPTDEKWKARETRTLEHVSGFRPPEVAIRLNKYGGRPDRRVEATGFFHARKIDRRWWIVDPEGCLWYSAGCCSVRPNPTPVGQAAMNQKYGAEAGWAKATAELLVANGFNNLGCWSHWENFQNVEPRLPYTTQSNFMSSYGKKRGGTYQKPGHTGYPNDCVFVFDAEFVRFCEEHAREKLADLKDDPYLLGHFSDNEMPFRADSLDRYMSLDESDEGYIAAKNWVDKHDAKKGEKGYSADDREAFLEHLSATYFRIVGASIKKADPNHMYLGARFHGAGLRYPAVFKGCGPYVDVVACNYYGAWTPNADRISDWVRWSGRPVMITEWYAKGMDSGMPNNSGAGWTVKTQKDRGRFYQNFTLALLEHPGCVGWHWFKYMDNDPTNTRVDPSNVDSNKGFVTSRYESYPELLNMMRQINTQAYPLLDFFMGEE